MTQKPLLILYQQNSRFDVCTQYNTYYYTISMTYNYYTGRFTEDLPIAILTEMMEIFKLSKIIKYCYRHLECQNLEEPLF